MMNKYVSTLLYYLGALGILGGFILSIISYIRICTTECGGAHNYTLCGVSFECFGLIFFPVLGALHYYSRGNRLASFTAALLVAAAAGSEIDFILLQKYEIKSYCPVCLAIAGCIGLIGLTYLIGYLIDLKRFLRENRRSDIMKSIQKAFLTLSFMLFGFIFAFVGVVKTNPLEAAEEAIKEKIALGNLSSLVEVYFFSDWQCPACRTVEPTMDKIAPKIMEKARLVFVDTIVHTETLNFIPYNLSFLINNKANYLPLRAALTEISKTNGNPTDEQVEKAIAPLGVKYNHINYADVAVGIKYFKHLVKEHDIEATPTMVIMNRNNKKSKKLMGSEINETNVMQAIDEMQK